MSQPFYDTKNRIQTFVPGVQSQVYPDSPEGLVFPKDPGIPRTLAPTQYNRFAPRLGIAYSPGATEGTIAKLTGGPGRTSIRVGSGLYYTAIEDVTLFNEVGDAPFGLFWVSPSPIYIEEPYKRRVGQQDPAGNRFPFTIPPPGATGIWSKYLPLAYTPGYNVQKQIAVLNSVQSGGGTRASEEFPVLHRVCGLARTTSAYHCRVEPRESRAMSCDSSTGLRSHLGRPNLRFGWREFGSELDPIP